jgi:uncharacterized protein (DUF2062 family)
MRRATVRITHPDALAPVCSHTGLLAHNGLPTDDSRSGAGDNRHPERIPAVPRRFLKRRLPDMHSLLADRRLRWFGLGLKDSDLFHLNRRSVSMAFFVGIFTAFIPAPGQLLIAGFLALLARCNLPIALALVFISNPVTVPPLTLLCYRVGALLLGKTGTVPRFEFTWEWLTTQGLHLVPTLLMGCAVVGLSSGLLGYLAVRWLWRWHAVTRWQQRKILRLTIRSARSAPEPPAPPATPDTGQRADSTTDRPEPPT